MRFRSERGEVIGDEPANTRCDPDFAEETLRQGEEGAGLPILHPLRQGLANGHSAPCLRPDAVQQRRARCGRDHVRADRGGRAGDLVEPAGRGTACEDVSVSAGATGDDPEARRRRASARHPDDPGPGGADRGEAGAGADLRDGPGAGGLWLPAGTQRGRRDRAGADPAAPAPAKAGGRATPTWSTPI